MSALWPLAVALDTVIQNDATLAAKLKGNKVYQLTAPAEDFALPYIVLSQSTETPGRVFGGKTYGNIETLDVWSTDLSKYELAGIVDDLERLLDGTTLPIAGFGFCVGVFSVVAIVLDQSQQYAHAACRYEVQSFA